MKNNQGRIRGRRTECHLSIGSPRSSICITKYKWGLKAVRLTGLRDLLRDLTLSSLPAAPARGCLRVSCPQPRRAIIVKPIWPWSPSGAKILWYNVSLSFCLNAVSDFSWICTCLLCQCFWYYGAGIRHPANNDRALKLSRPTKDCLSVQPTFKLWTLPKLIFSKTKVRVASTKTHWNTISHPTL